MAPFRDVVILLPGITGSVLARGGKEVWVPSVGAVWRAVTSLGSSVTGLELASDGDPGDVTAPRLIPDATIVPGLIKIDGYTRIEEYLLSELHLERGKNYFPFPYDWRLDNRVHARRLETQALDWLRKWQSSSGATDAKLILVGHSMGGLIARYFVEKLGGWKDTRALFTLGTPHRGSLNAVDFLVHGMKKGIGPLGLDLSPVLRSCPSVYQLLPIYRCIEDGPGEMSRVADAAAAGTLANVNAERARDARKFHTEIEDAQKVNAGDDAYAKSGYRVIPLVGIEQPTNQSARVVGNKVELLRSYAGKDDGGDGTVPRVSATPIEMSTTNSEVYAAEMHGALQNSAGVLANVRGVITRPDIDLERFRRGLPTTLTLDLDDVVASGEALTVRVRAGEGNPAITIDIANAESGETFREALTRSSEPGWQKAELDLPPGTWRITASAPGTSSVTDLAVVATA
jgi:pimeloyl-ACP methyl ester carboxylesterase